MGEAIVGDLCKTPDLSKVQSNSIADEKRVAKKYAKDGDFAKASVG